MSRRAPFQEAAKASSFLQHHFGDVSIVENDDGVTCALPGVFALKHVPETTPSGRFLRHIEEMSVSAPSQEEGLVKLANRVNQESVILKHFPQAHDHYQPDTAADYVVIARDEPLHQHDYAGYIDFNMSTFDDGELAIGSTATDALDTEWHVHLALAADMGA